tara:strand:+ start:146 stop:1159 length:1014 start_codon:yes stop_codon:yes gene_type:complete
LNVVNKIPKTLENNLNHKRIKKIYNNFEKKLKISENFIVAVSGGPDSLALAFLAKIYSIKKKLDVKFFIVDHKLREESSKEAKKTQKILKTYFIDAKILTWFGKKPLKNIQSIAREKRYQLLFSASDKHKTNNILLGHNENDLFENFFIRMLRGSGLKGLVSLDREVVINGKNLLRPLINEKKEDLRFIAKKVFNFYIDDPSNEDEKYLRVQIRKLIKEFQNKGFDRKKLITTIKNLKHSNNVVNHYVNENLRKNTFFSSKKKKLIIKNQYFNQPFEVILRSLSESVKFIGKRSYSVRGKKLAKIISKIENNRFYKQTLGGCIIEKVNQTIILSKEH